MQATLLNLPRYEIPECNWERLEQSLQKLEKQIIRRGGAKLRLAIIGRTMKVVRNVDIAHFVVVVDGLLPPLGDWELVGRLEYDRDLGANLAFLPTVDKDIPARFRHSGDTCDHCQTNRRRRHLLVIRNRKTFELKQVGTTCLRDFTNDATAEQIVAQMTVIEQAERELLKAVAVDASEPDLPKWANYGLSFYLAVAKQIIDDNNGRYVSRKWSDAQTPATECVGIDLTKPAILCRDIQEDR